MAARASMEKRKRGRVKLLAPAMEELDLTQSEVPLERQVYLVLRKAFMAGAVSSGAQLSSRSLAAALGVSSMPVREALKRLEGDGIVEARLKSAFVVRELTKQEFRETLEVRLRLEGLLAREAASRVDRSAIKTIERLHRQMTSISAGRDWDRLLSLNYRWHFEIYKSANLPYTLSLVENTWLKIGPALRKVQSEYVEANVYDHHPAILEALERGDPDAAEHALRCDLLAAADSIENLLA